MQQALREADYAEGGAREAMFRQTGETAGAESSGSGKLATGKSTATLCPVSGCAATWWPRWQYGHCASFTESWWCQPLTTTVEKTSSASSASETPRTRIVFRTVIRSDLRRLQNPIDSNWM